MRRPRHRSERKKDARQSACLLKRHELIIQTHLGLIGSFPLGWLGFVISRDEITVRGERGVKSHTKSEAPLWSLG